MNLEPLRAAASDKNVIAFLRMLRYGEGTIDDMGYSRMFGGQHFAGFTDHPRKANTRMLGGRPLTSTAAGAYQFLSSTWANLVKQYGFPDFTPEYQDLGAIALIKGRKALDDVIAGRFETAVTKCAKEWASLPGSPYGQPVVTMAKAKQIYEAAGGVYSVGAVTAPQEKPMGPFVIPAISAIVELFPKLATIFGSGSEVSNRNIKAVEMVMETAKEAINAKNEQDLAEIIKADPVAAQTVKEAIEAKWFELSELGGGVEAARKANAAYLEPGTVGFWHNPSFWISMVFLLMPFMLLVDVFYMHPENYVGDVRIQIVTGILLIISMVGGYWLGTSISSARKTEIAQK